MRPIKTSGYFPVAILMFVLVRCKDKTATSEANGKDTASVSNVSRDTATMPAYDPAMDPVLIGGPM